MSAINLPPGVRAYDPSKSTTPTSASIMATDTKEAQNNFLKMLIAQIQNQNPLDPSKPSEFTSQLSQLNMVQGVNDLNASMKSMLSQIQANDFMSQAQVVGKSALVPGNQFGFTGNPVVLGAEISGDVSNLKAVIRDVNGSLVDEVSLGAGKAGPVRLQWDGLGSQGAELPAGIYTLSFEANTTSGASVSVSSLVSAPVTAVGRNGDQLQIRLADGRTLAASDVVEWIK